MKPILVAYEGLSPLPPFSASYLTNELLPNISGASVEVYGWYQYPKTPVPASGQKLIVVGHSFGASKICGAAQSADLVVTIDPRWTGFDTFTASGSFGKWVNYYERNLFFNLPGCAVTGATQNVLVTEWPEDLHTNMPGYPPIAALINSFIQGVGG